MIHATQTSLPCPDWCELDTGHGFHSTDLESGALVRFHVRDFGPNVTIVVEEHAITDAGPIWWEEAPRVEVEAHDPLDLPATGRLMASLSTAAAFLARLS